MPNEFKKITTLRLIKAHDLNFVPEEIEVVKDGIILWKTKRDLIDNICFRCGSYDCICPKRNK